MKSFVPSIAGQAPFLIKNGAKSYRCWATVIPLVATRGYSVNGRTGIFRLRIPLEKFVEIILLIYRMSTS